MVNEEVLDEERCSNKLLMLQAQRPKPSLRDKRWPRTAFGKKYALNWRPLVYKYDEFGVYKGDERLGER